MQIAISLALTRLGYGVGGAVQQAPLMTWGDQTGVTSGSGVPLTWNGGNYDPWTPANIPNLASWYDAADTSTITQSSNLVSQWSDKGANGYNATQNPGSQQTTTGLRTLNGKNVISFGVGGNSTGFNLPNAMNFFAGSPSTLILLCRAETTGNNLPMIVTQNGGSPNGGLGGNFYGNSSFYAYGTNAYASAPTDMNPHLFIGWCDGTTLKYYIDGGTPATAAAGTPTSVSVNPNMGYLQYSGLYFTGDFAESVNIEAAASLATINQTIDYLNTKWATAFTHVTS